jgi:hypothetical protein
MRPATSRTPAESSDAVGLVIALLVHFPEIATIASHPAAGTIVLSFVVNRRLDRGARNALREAVGEHVRALLEVVAEEAQSLAVTCEADERVTFVRVVRDVKTFTRDELTMLTGFFSERFGEALLRSPSQDEPADEDLGARDDLVDFALEALRDPSRQKSLVGFREEQRVLVYFLKSRKKAKAAAR